MMQEKEKKKMLMMKVGEEAEALEG